MNRYVIVGVLVLLTAFAKAEPVVGFGYEEYKAVMKGFLTGIMIDEKYLPHLLSCLTDRKDLEVKFVETMNKIDRLDFTNLPLTAELFAELFDTLIWSVVEIDLCAEENSDYDKLFQKIYRLTSSTMVKRIMLNFISNPQQIFKDMQDCIDNYLGGKFERLGYDLGDIMHILLIYRMVNDEMNLEEYIKLLKGLLTGMNVKNDVEKILKCVEKVPSVIALISKALEDLKHIDMSHLKEMVEGLIKVFQAIKGALLELGVCASGYADIKAIIEKLSHIELADVIQRVALNIMKIISELINAKAAAETKNYEKLGTHIGSIIYIVLLSSQIE